MIQQCMGMNPWFTGLGLGYDPTNKVETGNEWLVRLVLIFLSNILVFITNVGQIFCLVLPRKVKGCSKNLRKFIIFFLKIYQFLPGSASLCRHNLAILFAVCSRGDKGVTSASLDAAYIVLWNRDMKKA